jgi:hypothetical protein
MEHERLYTLGKPKACPIIRSGVGVYLSHSLLVVTHIFVKEHG